MKTRTLWAYKMYEWQGSFGTLSGSITLVWKKLRMGRKKIRNGLEKSGKFERQFGQTPCYELIQLHCSLILINL
jgi:hypothetical protein